jgi:TIGR03009 family protein
MRGNVRTVLWVLVASCAASSPRAQAQAQAQAQAPARPAPAKAAPAPQPDPQKMEWLLQKWAGQSTKLKSLDVTIKRVDIDPTPAPLGGEEHYLGRALFKAPGLACIDFRKVVGDPKQPKPETKAHERIVCTGQEVWQYRSDTQQIFIFPLENDAQKRALAQGPLPFLFNFRADDAKNRYDMTLLRQTKDSYLIAIRPKLEIDKDGFSVAMVELDSKFLLPIRVTLVAPNGKDKKDFKLENIQPNLDIPAENFVGKMIGPPWKVVRNDPEAPAPAPASRTPAAAAPRAGSPPRQATSRYGFGGR